MTGPGSRMIADERILEILRRDIGERAEPFAGIWTLCVQLNWKVEDFLDAYGPGPYSFEILHAMAPNFVAHTHEIWLEAIFMRMRRLTEPATTRNGKRNESLGLLVEVFPDLRAELTELVGQAKSSSAWATDWCNQRIAHTAIPDQNSKLKLASPSADRLRSTVKAIKAPVDLIGRKRIQRHDALFDVTRQYAEPGAELTGAVRDILKGTAGAREWLGRETGSAADVDSTTLHTKVTTKMRSGDPRWRDGDEDLLNFLGTAERAAKFIAEAKVIEDEHKSRRPR